MEHLKTKNPEIEDSPNQHLTDLVDDLFTSTLDPDYTGDRRTFIVRDKEGGEQLSAVSETKHFEAPGHKLSVTMVHPMDKSVNEATRYLTIIREPDDSDPRVRTTVIKLGNDQPLQFTHTNNPGSEKVPKSLKDSSRDNAIAFLEGAHSVITPVTPRRQRERLVILDAQPTDADIIARWPKGIEPEVTTSPPKSEVELVVNPNPPEHDEVVFDIPVQRGEASEQFKQQDMENMRLLEQSELGYILKDAYIAAVQIDPRIADTKLVPIAEESSSVAFARPAWSSESGKHEVHIQLHDLDKALAKVQEMMDKIPGARELLAEKMGVGAEQVTPQLVHVFSIMHEIGHTSEFREHEDNPEDFRRHNARAKASLPIGGVAVSKMVAPQSEIYQKIAQSWDEVGAELSVHDFTELAELQHKHYRDLPSENYADRFGKAVLYRNPQLIDQLTSDNFDYYRHYSAAA